MKITLETACKIEGIKIFSAAYPEENKCEIEDVFKLFCSIITTTQVYGETKMIIDNCDGPIEYIIKKVTPTE